MEGYFFLGTKKRSENAELINQIESFSTEFKKLVYLLDRPLTDSKYSYIFEEALIILSPKHKIIIINFGTSNQVEFDDFFEDIIEDIGSISDKYNYKNTIGRTREWRDSLIYKINELPTDIKSIFVDSKVESDNDIKKIDLLISLFIGSINDIERVKADVPQTALDKVKQKIQLFDGEQTKFIYQKPTTKRITIQGLSGTGKTELLLHKLKDIYTTDLDSRIFFTCHNKILADKLRKRIPTFFNFMKVEQQIEWNSRLWCINAWGGSWNENSGTYRYICDYYEIPFYGWSRHMTFSKACQDALGILEKRFPEGIQNYAFDYIFIDESQDFDENFFKLCEFVCKKNVYIAGDIFQNIFDEKITSSITPDFLLGKCYRTDPKTLMYAHALGMGLFDEQKLRWLEEKEWGECGYTVENDLNNLLHLSREPIRRFEDIDDNFESIKVVEHSGRTENEVIKIINEIKDENPTALPDDIGIIFLDVGNYVYSIADLLEFKIQDELGWDVNKAYESKEERNGSIFISNRNNVKGLEFPFVICITSKITNNPGYRNSLYTMLTRSFIRSYFVIPNTSNSGLSTKMKSGLKEILTTGKMTIEIPSETEKEAIRTRFKGMDRQKSRYDLLMDIFQEQGIKKDAHEKLIEMSKIIGDEDNNDKQTLSEFIRDNYKYLK